MKKSLFFLFVVLQAIGFASLPTNQDSIRGALRPERNCFDVTFYDLFVNIDPEEKKIVGKNDIYFKAIHESKTIQIDLFRQYEIIKMELYAPIDTTGVEEVISASYERVGDALFITFGESIKPGRKYKLRISYFGKPNVAKKAPWDGGFVWSKDSLNRHFCGVACEGWGASSWWPCKDHLSDEPDSMKMTFTVPKGYECISNGQLIKQCKKTDVGSGHTTSEVFEWKVTYPINSYNVTFYLGKFKKVSDWYVSDGDSLLTEFYALDYNYEKAKNHFKQVHPMLSIYEELFGRFPFWDDGFKLVEAPYLGMEHQSAIAYGNMYKKGYLGRHPKGLEFDYIIIHETGHEYWGNSVSMNDIADMWIHEGFCTYSEVLYVEKMYGKELMIEYLRAQRRIKNDKPIIGNYHINEEGSGDMYNKGSWMLHTIRNYVEDDSLWFATIKEFHLEFQRKNTNTMEVLNWFYKKLGKDVNELFKRYLYQADVPIIEYQKKRFLWRKNIRIKWKSEALGFNLPIKVNGIKVYPTSEWLKIKVKSFKKLRKQLDCSYALYDLEEISKKK